MKKKKVTVTFYMKSGNSFSLNFTEFEISKLSEYKDNRKMTYGGNEKIFTIDVNEIEACIIN